MRTYLIYPQIINILLILIYQTHSSLRIPLTYAYSSNNTNKYPIQLSFDISQTYTPENLHQLILFNYNIQLNTKINNKTDKVIIGLKYPSDFIFAISKKFNVQLHQIQFQKDQFLELVIGDLKLIQSIDKFQQNASYSIETTYNYGPKRYIEGQICQLIDSQLVYFNQILITEILNKIEKQSNIKYQFNESQRIITLSGSIENFPKITLKRNSFEFNLQIKTSKLNYFPNFLNQTTKIGIYALKDFNTFQIQRQIIFKRSQTIYMLYLFLAYFFLFTLFMIISCRKNMFKSMKFIKSILNWALFKDNRSRIQVLRTELQ